VEPLLNPKRDEFRWWTRDWSTVWALERHAQQVDPSIQRLPFPLRRNNPDLRKYLEREQVPVTDFLGYLAPAEGPWTERRIVVLFHRDPRSQDPFVLCLDGPKDSKHRNGPRGESIELCLYYTRDPDERRWKLSDGLPRLFDLARKHVLAEHLWRLNGRKDTDWPIEDAPHGHTRPAPAKPELALPVEIQQFATRGPWLL